MSKNETDVVHSTFVIERTYPASPARVFAAFADPAVKNRWFMDKGEGATLVMDFRVGGTEKSRFSFHGVPGGPPAGTPMGNDTVYLDIVENERIVFAYAMLLGDRRFSVSLVTVLITPAGRETRLTFTEQAAFFGPSDGPDGRKRGWTDLLDKLGRALES